MDDDLDKRWLNILAGRPQDVSISEDEEHACQLRQIILENSDVEPKRVQALRKRVLQQSQFMLSSKGSAKRRTTWIPFAVAATMVLGVGVLSWQSRLQTPVSIEGGINGGTDREQPRFHSVPQEAPEATVNGLPMHRVCVDNPSETAAEIVSFIKKEGGSAVVTAEKAGILYLFLQRQQIDEVDPTDLPTLPTITNLPDNYMGRVEIHPVSQCAADHPVTKE